VRIVLFEEVLNTNINHLVPLVAVSWYQGFNLGALWVLCMKKEKERPGGTS